MSSRYSQQLKDVRWQRVRLRKMEAAGWQCEKCGGITGGLHVHHKAYIPGVAPWDYPDRLLSCVCEECHQKAHGGQIDTTAVEQAALAIFDATPDSPRCAACGFPVTNPQGYGQDRRVFYCEQCVREQEGVPA